MTRTLGLTGATGFIGSHVLKAALVAGWSVRALVRSAQPQIEGVAWVPADLRNPTDLSGAFTGLDAVLHCASAIGGDRPLLEAVNVGGTAAVVMEAAQQGIKRLGILSTAAVYRREQCIQAREGELAEEPGSRTSETRLRAENIVREAGGFAVRPHLVTGPGDRWVIPTGARVVRHLGWPRDASLQSFVDVRDLAGLMVLLLEADSAPGATFHASHPGRTWREILEPLGIRGSDAVPIDMGDLDPRQVALMEGEHTYSSEHAKQTVGWTAVLDPMRPDANALAWYRRHLMPST